MSCANESLDISGHLWTSLDIGLLPFEMPGNIILYERATDVRSTDDS